MNTAIIMLGSNTNAKRNMEHTFRKLLVFFEIINKSVQVDTEPVGADSVPDFNNIALKISTNKPREETVAIFKQIEREAGRRADSKLTGIIPIDIDLIFWNDMLVHDDYNRFEYVQNCVNEIK